MLLDQSASIDILDPQDAAETAGLTYVSDEEPGIRRKKAAKGFTYVHPGGGKVEDEATLKRIRKLAPRPPMRMSGSVPRRTATSRRPAAMPRAASSTATMPISAPS